MIALRSSLLAEHGFVHGFSLRNGGVSEGPYASLNLARTVGDDAAAVAINFERFAAFLGDASIYEVSQVHGADVVEVGPTDEVSAVRLRSADALVTRVVGAAVAVRTADCVPILVADLDSGAVAAVHAGWRGIVANVIGAAVARLGGARCVAAVGPHIRRASFEVSSDVAEEIARVAPDAPLIEARTPRPHADLTCAALTQLQAAGVLEVDDVGGDTFAEPARFYSHRRDRGVTGRHLSAICVRRT